MDIQGAAMNEQERRGDRESVVSRYASGESLRRAGQYDKALALFQELADDEAGPDVLWRVAYCLRRLGRIEEADQAIARALEKFDSDPWVRREAAWITYEKALKPAVAAEDLEAACEAARRMMDLAGDEPLVRERAVFCAIKVARSRRDWDQVVAWTDELDPETLSTDKREIDGRTVMSPREQWYFARLKGLVGLRRWDEARQVADRALEQFPGRRDFVRWRALARAELGELESAIADMQRLVERERAWYLLDTLADLHARAGDLGAARRAAARALLAPGELKSKVALIARLATWLDAEGLDGAAEQALLAIRIREAEGWGVPEALIRLAAGAPEDRRALSELARAARERWKSLAQEGATEETGRVVRLIGSTHLTTTVRQRHDIRHLAERANRACKGVGS